SGRLDSPGGVVRDQDTPPDGQDAEGTPGGPAVVLRRDDHERPDGGDEQQDQDDEAAGVWVPGPGVLQAQDPCDPRDEVCAGRMIVRSLSHINLRQCELGARFNRMNPKCCEVARWKVRRAGETSSKAAHWRRRGSSSGSRPMESKTTHMATPGMA